MNYLGQKTLNIHRDYCGPTTAITRTTVKDSSSHCNQVSQTNHQICKKSFNIHSFKLGFSL